MSNHSADPPLRPNSVSTRRDPKTGEWIVDGRFPQPPRCNSVEVYRNPQTGEWIVKPRVIEK